MKRVLVTAPAEDTAGLLATLRSHGHEAVGVPVVSRPWRVGPLREALLAQQPAIVVVMSALAANVLALALPAPPAGARIVALGASTVRRLGELGWAAEVEAAEGAVGLGQALAAIPGEAVAVVQGEGLDPSWLDVARVHGKVPVHHPAWTQEAPAGLTAALLEALPVDVTVVASVIAARHLAKALPVEHRAGLGSVVAVGPGTKAGCDALGMLVSRHSPRGDVQGVVALVEGT